MHSSTEVKANSQADRKSTIYLGDGGVSDLKVGSEQESEGKMVERSALTY